jgi:hypothetical protein
MPRPPILWASYCPGLAVLDHAGVRRGDRGDAEVHLARRSGRALRTSCCPKKPVRKVPRSLFEGARDMARRIGQADVSGRGDPQLRLPKYRVPDTIYL